MKLTQRLGYPQWESFQARNPDQALVPFSEWSASTLDAVRLRDVSLLMRATKAFSWLKDKTDTWELKLPGDCDEYVLCLRAMIHKAGILDMGQMQPAICLRNDEGHMVLILRGVASDYYVADPVFADSTIPMDRYQGEMISASDGKHWRVVSRELKHG